MDSKQIAQRLADRTGYQLRDAVKMIETLGAVIAESCSNLDTIAIPGFGNFSATKHDERIEVDPLTMQRTLMPPSITPEFRPSVILRRRLLQ